MAGLDDTGVCCLLWELRAFVRLGWVVLCSWAERGFVSCSVSLRFLHFSFSKVHRIGEPPVTRIGMCGALWLH